MWTSSLAERAKSALAYARQYVQEQPLGEKVDPTGRSGSTWGGWLREWGSASRSTFDAKEEVSLVPGWAARVPRAGPCLEGICPFDIHLSVSGYAALSRSLSEATRGQRALVSLAKRFAALPRPLDVPLVASSESGSFPATSQLDPILKVPMPTEEPPRPQSQTIETTDTSFALPNVAQIANRNLDLRLAPFWSKPLAFRPIRIVVESPTAHQTTTPRSLVEASARTADTDPLLIVCSSTDGQGHFAHRLVIPWERLCTHPSWFDSLPRSRNDDQRWRLRVSVRLGANKSLVTPSSCSSSTEPEQTNDRAAVIEAVPGLSPSCTEPSRRGGDLKGSSVDGSAPNTDLSRVQLPGLSQEQGICSVAEGHLEMAVQSDGGIRIISDLDDTVKHSDILAGGRETFRNVFCRPLSEICIPGAGEMFRAAKRAGAAGFHFVSNSPFELLPSIREFLSEHRFPGDYSLKLKYYGGRSILTALFESPADRKRPAILEILQGFPSARFILFGDSAEQDLELYVSIARERRAQIAAIYIRDISSEHDLLGQLSSRRDPLVADTTPGEAGRFQLRDPLPLPPSRRSTQQGSEDWNSASPQIASSTTEEANLEEELQALSAAQQKLLRRAAAWRSRLAQARLDVPESVDLVIFRDVHEITQRVVQQIRESQNCSGQVNP